MKMYYFTYWIERHGRDAFKKLSDQVLNKISVPNKIKEEMGTDEYLFHYFFVVYYTIALNYFELPIEKISFLVDFILIPGTCKLFSPKEILETQKDMIPIIEEYIKKDLQLYDEGN